MTSDAGPRPVDVSPFPNGEIGVRWSDGHESFYPSFDLRCACACATCVDEASGEKLLRDESVPTDIRPIEIHPVGLYGLSVKWSDQHETGIYSHRRLRELCPCEACSR
ncbi:MAG: DUF971 domain-containing protein [bacterium]|nr:DUF971 domain-containing protein [bacterium]